MSKRKELLELEKITIECLGYVIEDLECPQYDFSDILLDLYSIHKHESWMLSRHEIERKKTKLFGKGIWEQNLWNDTIHFGLLSGIVLESRVYVSDTSREFNIFNLKILVSPGKCVDIPGLINFSLFQERLKIISHDQILVEKDFHRSQGNPETAYKIALTPPEINFINDFLTRFSEAHDKLIDSLNAQKLQYEIDIARIREELNRPILARKLEIIQFFDPEATGRIKIKGGENDFMMLFKKHQPKIRDIDKQYIQLFVKLAGYLQTKRKNIQKVFSSIESENRIKYLDNTEVFLKNQIHFYEVLVLNSITMITAVVEDDFITFYQIYEAFDKLNIFNSNWENEVSQKLSNINNDLNHLMHSIDSMERNIVENLKEICTITQSGFSGLHKSVTQELQSINSTIEFNNLLTGISAYQLYKLNK